MGTNIPRTKTVPAACLRYFCDPGLSRFQTISIRASTTAALAFHRSFAYASTTAVLTLFIGTSLMFQRSLRFRSNDRCPYVPAVAALSLSSSYKSAYVPGNRVARRKRSSFHLSHNTIAPMTAAHNNEPNTSPYTIPRPTPSISFGFQSSCWTITKRPPAFPFPIGYAGGRKGMRTRKTAFPFPLFESFTKQRCAAFLPSAVTRCRSPSFFAGRYFRISPELFRTLRSLPDTILLCRRRLPAPSPTTRLRNEAMPLCPFFPKGRRDRRARNGRKRRSAGKSGGANQAF